MSAAEALSALLDRLSSTVTTTIDGSVFVTAGQHRHALRGPVTAHQPKHTFHDVSSFALWVRRWWKSQSAEILFSAPAGQSSATFRGIEDASMASPGLVSCQLLEHPRVARWRKACGAPLNQQSFYKLVALAKADFPEDKDGVSQAHRLLSALRTLRASRSTQFAGELDDRGRFRVATVGTTTDISATFDSELVITLPLYAGGCQREYLVKVLVDVDVDKNNQPVFELSMDLTEVRMEAARDEARNLTNLLRGLILDGKAFPEIAPDWLVGIGDLGTEAVSAIGRVR